MRLPRGASRGQSAIELALTLPVLLILMLGTFEIGTHVLNRTVAAQAARQGARLAGELGAGDYDPVEKPNPDPTPEDRQIVEAVMAITGNACGRAGGMRNFRLERILIMDGAVSPDLAKPNVYDGCGNLQVVGYTRPDRRPEAPFTRRIRVSLAWRYFDPGSMFNGLFQGQESPSTPPGVFSESAVMPISPPPQ